jgi:hypothetical protein
VISYSSNKGHHGHYHVKLYSVILYGSHKTIAEKEKKTIRYVHVFVI